MYIKKIIVQSLNKMKKKTVYIALTADSIHHGHMRLIEKGRQLGDITIWTYFRQSGCRVQTTSWFLNFLQRKNFN